MLPLRHGTDKLNIFFSFQDAHENEVFCVCWSPAGRFLGTGGADRKIKLWKSEDGKTFLKFNF